MRAGGSNFGSGGSGVRIVAPGRAALDPVRDQLDLLLRQALIVLEAPKPFTAPQGGIRRDSTASLMAGACGWASW